MTIIYRYLLMVLLGLLTLTPVTVRAQTLQELDGAEALPKSYDTDKPYAIVLLYTDPKGDEVKPKDALLIDQGPAGSIKIQAVSVTGDPTTGARITWKLNKMAQGSHAATFQVTNEVGKVTEYPKDGAKYEFVVESLTTKIIIFAVILAIALFALPLIIYLIARALNPRGDPSKAARMGLLLGIVSCFAAFVLLFFSTLFTGPYSWLGWAIMGVLALAVLVILLRR